MLTMAILAMIGAFILGFVLCGMFTVGAAADRPDYLHPRPVPDPSGPARGGASRPSP